MEIILHLIRKNGWWHFCLFIDSCSLQLFLSSHIVHCCEFSPFFSYSFIINYLNTKQSFFFSSFLTFFKFSVFLALLTSLTSFSVGQNQHHSLHNLFIFFLFSLIVQMVDSLTTSVGNMHHMYPWDTSVVIIFFNISEIHAYSCHVQDH